MILQQTKTNFPSVTTTGEMVYAYTAGMVVTVVPKKLDGQTNLIVPLEDGLAILPPECCDLYLRSDGSNRYCLSAKYLGRPIQCKVSGQTTYQGESVWLLDHACIQQEVLDNLTPGTIVDATVTAFLPAGAFCELSCGLATLLPISRISVNRLSHPSDMLSIGQQIKAVVYSVTPDGRVVLSLKELLGTWEENCASLHEGDTVLGVVRSIEDYGTFVQLDNNLAGLANCHDASLCSGNVVAATIRKIDPEKMKVKLSLYSIFHQEAEKPVLEYHLPESGHLDTWRYSPAGCSHCIETVFG